MPAVLSIVGKSKVGKTTLLEKLIPEIRRRGYRVGTLKHDAHDHFEIDHVGKDTWRHREAGAQTVAISSPSRFALTKATERELDLDSIIAVYFSDEDLVLTEGYKGGSKAKIDLLTIDGAPGGTGMSPWRMMNEWGIPTVELECLTYQMCERLAAKGAYIPPIAVGGGLSLEDHMFKVLALGAPYVKAVLFGRAIMTAGMVGKTHGKMMAEKMELEGEDAAGADGYAQ